VDSLPVVASVVVPFRAASAKRRLEPLDEEARGQLAHRMLASVIEAAIAVGPTILVTETDADCARALAAEHGLEVVDDPGRGQGAAVAAALEVVPEWPVLVVNADLPEARPRDLLALLGAMPEDGIAIAPAPDGTTNALALSRPGLFAPLYGERSAARFLAHAEELGFEAMELEIPGLARDVDTVAELARIAR
jgi:2-phospho-L-lactate guanylyltransferase